VSLFGDIRLSRTYYYCSRCGASQRPWDQMLGLTERHVTPAAEELASLAGTLSGFGSAAKRTLIRMSGIRLSESTVRRVTEDAGERLGAKLAAQQTFGGQEHWPWQRDAEGKRCAYAAIDHTGVPQQAAGGGPALIVPHNRWRKKIGFGSLVQKRSKRLPSHGVVGVRSREFAFRAGLTFE